MSYSFSVRANSKEEARKNAADYFDSNVIPGQPVHARDKPAMLATLDAYLALVNEPGKGEYLSIAVHGSVSWRGEDSGLVGASVGVSIATLGA